MADFTTVYSNNLAEVQMISGDERIFYYSVYDETGNPVSLIDATPRVVIFKYGDPSYAHWVISGSLILDGISDNQFSITFNGFAKAGVFQQQVVIEDADGNIHIPSQGKIIIFPSNPGAVTGYYGSRNE